MLRIAICDDQDESLRLIDRALDDYLADSQGLAADVSRYVERGSYLNKEAMERGTSVYFPEFAIPMLPEVLSNGVCSLVPHEDRYTVTCRMVFDASGNKKEAEFYRSVINSNHRLALGASPSASPSLF